MVNMYFRKVAFIFDSRSNVRAASNAGGAGHILVYLASDKIGSRA